MQISVTFPAGPSGPLALVRFKEPGKRPDFRSLPLGGTPAESVEDVEAFILAHLEDGGCWQGWLWET